MVNKVVINEYMYIDMDRQLLYVNKKFAIKNLSQSALLGVKEDRGNYVWEWGKNATVVVFELPSLFSLDYNIVHDSLCTNCKNYLNDLGVHPSALYVTYLKNSDKPIKV